MLIKGDWHLCDDEIYRPVIIGEIRSSDNLWVKVPMLLDTGADRTVLAQI
ncbi:MAG: hypothetical protein QGF00_29730 [Planctomycetota bacterium]|jgi:hypothetical protein|nr:hypothetical protein [Planctomycetota bacterium]